MTATVTTATTEPPTADETPNHVTVTAADLLLILRAAHHFTDENEGALPLQAVHIQAGNGAITATGTNRYILGHARKPATGQLAALIGRDDIDLVTLMLDEVHDTVPVTIMSRPSHVATTASVTFYCSDRSVTVPTVDATFPDLTAAFASAPTAGASSLDGPIALNLGLFDAFRETRDLDAGSRYDPCRLYFTGPTKPVRVEIGDWFVGLIMPVQGRAAVADIPNVPFGLPPLSTTPAQTTEG